MDGSFIDKLRMANIFGGDKPLGMPDLSAGQINPDLVSSLLNRLGAHKYWQNRQEADIANSMGGRPQLSNIARSAMTPSMGSSSLPGPRNVDPNSFLPGTMTTKPMDVVYKPPLSETYQGLLGMQKERELGLKEALGFGKLGQGEEKLRQSSELGNRKLDISEKQGQQNIDIKKGQLSINEFKAMHPNLQITKEEGGNWHGWNPATNTMVDLGPTGTVTEEKKQQLIGQREKSNIEARGNESRKTEEVRGTNRLSEIAARANEQRNTNAARQDVRGMLPTQDKVRQITGAHQLINERPELGELIAFDPASGLPINNADPNSPEFQMINDRLYGKSKDINLPPGKKKSDPLRLRK